MFNNFRNFEKILQANLTSNFLTKLLISYELRFDTNVALQSLREFCGIGG